MRTNKSTFENPSFKAAYPSYCIVEPDQKPSSKSHDVHDQSDEFHEIKADVFPSVHNPIPSTILERYKPLKLPYILHNFPPKHYKYLPVFDGEPDILTAEKHVQDFEHFAYLFEIDYDDVLVREFSQSI
jgi:hypothetical protein